MADIVALCREAWNANKKPHQPAFDDLTEVYRERLIAAFPVPESPPEVEVVPEKTEEPKKEPKAPPKVKVIKKSAQKGEKKR
jgi:hypothetical protein